MNIAKEYYAPIIVFIIAFFIYFFNYQYPQGQYWDENYHIASAQKYIDGVMYMEPHPPLGKMILAVGEVITDKNSKIEKNYFLETDYIQNFPQNYSFAGMRLMSVIFATIASIIFFYIILEISNNQIVSLLFSSLYLFENATILHTRGAMIEGIQIFFVLLQILLFITLIKKERISLSEYLYMGLLTGLNIMTKANGAIMLLIFIFMFFNEHKYNINRDWIMALLKKASISIIGILIIVVSVWQIHFSIGKKIVNDRFYGASEEYKTIIQTHSQNNPMNFFVMLKDNLKYMDNYQKGVPQLDLCKVGENGSYSLGWVVGNKSISYRWSKDEKGTSYLYLQGNPLVWFLSLFGVILSISLIVSHYIFGNAIKNRLIFKYIQYMTVLYVSYMIAVSQIDRVMYLYHYFLPFLFTMIILFLVFYYIFEDILTKTYIPLGLLALEIFIVFLYFSPFTYYMPLNISEFMGRNWFSFWHLNIAF
jgi:dolichyl-phosphate-mannose--protein O-mannosyl transferase